MPKVKVTMTDTNGNDLAIFESFTLVERFSEPIDRLTATLRPGRDQFKKYRDLTRKGEKINVQVDGKPQAQMMIQSAERTLSSDGGAVIALEACSTLQLLIEGFVEPSDAKRLDSDEPIIDLVNDFARRYGIDEVQAEADVATLKAKTGRPTGAKSKKADQKKYKAAASGGTEAVYQFLNRLCTRNGIMIRQHAEGALIMTAPHYDGKALYTLCQPNRPNPPSGDFVSDPIVERETNEGQFSFAEVNGVPHDDDGETETAAPKERVLSTDINSTNPPFRSTAAFSYKPCFHRDENSKDATHARNVSKLILGHAAEHAYQVILQVPSLVSQAGIPWTVDTLARVWIPDLELDEDMWIAERTLMQSAEGGQSASITLTPKGYFVIGDES